MKSKRERKKVQNKKGLLESTFAQLILIVVSFVLIILLVSKIFSGTGALQDMICKAVPFLCGAQKIDDFEKAKESTEALTCAINSVLKGEKINSGFCNDYSVNYTSRTSGTGFLTALLTGLQISKETQEEIKPTFDCNLPPQTPIQLTSPDETKNKKNTKQTKTSDIPLDTCKVTNFYLPERFNGWTGSAKEYISGFGDPTFLVYFQKFPEGEDEAWASEESWFHGIGTMIFTTMCVSHFIAPFVKAGKWVLSITKPTKIKDVTLKSGEKLTDKLSFLRDALKKAGKTEEEINLILKEDNTLIVNLENIKNREDLIKLVTDYIKAEATKDINLKIIEYFNRDFSAFKKAVEEYYGSEAMASESMKTMLKRMETIFKNPDLMKDSEDLSRFIPKETLEKIIETTEILGTSGKKINSGWKVFSQVAKSSMAPTAMYTGIDSIGAYIAAMIDNQIKKTIPIPSAIVLNSPFKELTSYELLNYESYGKEIPIPILLKKSKKDKTSFYLASPCKTDLYITESMVYCSEYIYKKGSNYVECKVVSEDDVYKEYYEGMIIKIPFVGVVADKEEVLQYVPSCKNVIYYGGKRKMFNDANNDGKWDEIILFSDWGKDYIHEDVKIKDNNYDGIFDEAMIFKGRKVIVLDETGGKEDSDGDGVFEKEYKVYYDDSVKKISIIENGMKLCEDKIEYPYDDLFIVLNNKIYVNEPSSSCKYITPVVSLRLEGSTGAWNEIYVGVYPLEEGNLQTIFKDINGDGNWEIKQEKGKNKPTIEVTDTDGEVFRSEWCETDAIEISADENKIDEYKITINGNEYNFCYAKNNAIISDVVTVGSIFVDVFVKKSGVGGWLLGTASDCALAYFNAKTKIGIWPKR